MRFCIYIKKYNNWGWGRLSEAHWLLFQSQGAQCPSLVGTRQKHGAQTYKQAKHPILIRIKKEKPWSPPFQLILENFVLEKV